MFCRELKKSEWQKASLCLASIMWRQAEEATAQAKQLSEDLDRAQDQAQRLTWASGSFTAGFGKRAAELSRWFHDGFNHHVNDKGIVKSNNNDYSSIGNKSNCIAIERRPAAATMKVEVSAVAAIAAAALLGDSFELQCLVPVAEAGSEQTYAKERLAADKINLLSEMAQAQSDADQILCDTKASFEARLGERSRALAEMEEAHSKVHRCPRLGWLPPFNSFGPLLSLALGPRLKSTEVILNDFGDPSN
ncbi:unnamed protein product [Symbiodinium sp. KB8]|nr:unnamed protein product [Symbiodinium sp. KB8]